MVESKKRWPEKKNLESKVFYMPREMNVLRRGVKMKSVFSRLFHRYWRNIPIVILLLKKSDWVS